MVQQGPTNKQLVKTITALEMAAKKNKAPLWKRAAELLSKPTRQRPEANLSKISKCKTGTALIPGKVLSTGESSKITVAAFAFSAKAREKIVKAGGKTISLQQLLETNPSGKDVSIII